MDRGERVERKGIYDGRIVRLSLDTVRLPNGHVTEMELIRHPGAAAIVPIDAQGRVILVRQYRYAAGEWLLEVPAGKLDPDETPEDCARREVEEEIGFRPESIHPLGWIFTTPGFTDERIWLYLATELTETRANLEPDELLSVRRFSMDEAIELAGRGEIHDAKTICALFRAHRLLGDAQAAGKHLVPRR